MTCYYHNRDLDGFACGAIMKRKFPDAKFVGYDYGMPFEQIPGEPIIMADGSLPMPEMLKAAQMSGFQFTWIDHHASAIKDYNEVAAEMESFLTEVLQDGISACEGAWNYFFPEEEMPLAIRLLGEYDTWRNGDLTRWEDEILPFQYGMRLRCNSLETFPMWIFDAPEIFIRQIVASGSAIIKYQTQQDEMVCRLNAFEFEFEGLRAICLNTTNKNSQVFKSVYDESNHDIMMPFQWTGNGWSFSLYTTKESVDCSLIAKRRNGGGHKKAAGFKVDDIASVFPHIKSWL